MTEHLDSYEGPSGDSALVRLLYPAPAERRAGAIFKWWEKRRLPYNLIVGASGLATLTLNALVFGPPSGAAEVFFPIAAVGIFANIAYTLGSIVEVTVNNRWGRNVLPVGPVLFRQGVLFSVGLTFVLPTIIITIGAIARTLGWIFGG
ncbi:MAG: hypothetical protein OEU54_13835 [Gemmatimonadota bacterium]|nr:hypothetical protein [Gemmatimonadota bacterium]